MIHIFPVELIDPEPGAAVLLNTRSKRLDLQLQMFEFVDEARGKFHRFIEIIEIGIPVALSPGPHHQGTFPGTDRPVGDRPDQIADNLLIDEPE